MGELKHKLEKEILREARSSAKEVYNYNIALPLARKLLEGPPSSKNDVDVELPDCKDV